MPNRDVTFIRDTIYHQHANILAKSALAAPDCAQGLGKAPQVGEANLSRIEKGSQELRAFTPSRVRFL